MVDTKVLLGVVPTIQAASLVGQSTRLLKKKKKKSSDFLSSATGFMVGTAFIKSESDIIAGF